MFTITSDQWLGRRLRRVYESFLKTGAVLFIALGVPLAASSPHASAAEFNLAWDASPSADVGGYNLHYGLSSGAYSNTLDVGSTTQHMLTGLDAGETYFIAVTAYNGAVTSESGFSNEVSATTPAGPPVAAFSAAPTAVAGRPSTWV